MKLYEITKDYQKLSEAVQTLGIEADEEINAAMALLSDTIEEKCTNISKLLNVFKSDKESVDNEIKRLQALKKIKSNAIDRLKDYLMFSLETAGIEKLDVGLFKISIRNNAGKVIIEDADLISKKYIKTETIEKIDKKMIKDEYKETGILPEGSRFEKTKSLMIK